MNKALLEWYTGGIRDDDFQDVLRDDFKFMDPEASRLMHIIFKEKIEGHKVSITEKMQAKEMTQNKKSKISNLARFLFDHPALQDPFSANLRSGVALSKKVNSGLNMEMSGVEDKNSAKFNKIIPLSADFKPKSIFISNNENFIGVIDDNKLFVYDSKSGKVVYTTNLPPATLCDSDDDSHDDSQHEPHGIHFHQPEHVSESSEITIEAEGGGNSPKVNEKS